MTTLPDDIGTDQDGYPDDAKLRQITEADAVAGGARWMVETFPLLAGTMRPYAHCEVFDTLDAMDRPAKRIEFSTGGWSGCEALVNAVLGNPWLRVHYYSWRRGGHYVFEVPVSALKGGA